jgi:hypothetical protein
VVTMLAGFLFKFTGRQDVWGVKMHG